MSKTCPRCHVAGRGNGRFLIVHVESTVMRGPVEFMPIRSCRKKSSEGKICGYWRWM